MSELNDEDPRTIRPGDPIPPDSVIGNSGLWEGELREDEPDLLGPVTAWQSLPGAVRVAVWLWTVATIVGCVVGVVVGFAFLVSL